MKTFANLLKKLKSKLETKDVTEKYQEFYKYALYIINSFVFSASVPALPFHITFLGSLLIYVFVFSNVAIRDSIIISGYSIFFFLSLFGLKELVLEEYLALSTYRIFFIFPYFIIPSTLFFLIERKKATYLCTILPVFAIGIIDQLNDSILSVSLSWIFGSMLSFPFLSKSRRRFSLFKVASIYGVFGAILLMVFKGGITESALFILSAIISPFISISVLYFFERVFNILTPFYLFDLQDIEHPLLVQLRQRAPGTFHHSLVVADIAYIAAKEVGANAELVRCAALYHDIGKMVRPEYFIENVGGMTAHMKINIPMSSKLVIRHVEDGEKLARSYSLPQRIIDFILEHHGTTYPEYFVKAAKKLDIQLDSRYPGPSPRSLETVIMMICDSSEAAVRSLEEYKVEKINEIISKVIKSKLEQGQFDNAPVTIQQLKRIQEAVVKALTDFYHLRISYDEKSIEKYIEMKKQTNINGEDKEISEQKRKKTG
ncbi:MAG: HDIG domain-containing protein [Candidatus Calescibacterium sp.]|nr:HDIG domain-containing protein [Candidatus Calescibacterium sp.]MCX7733391.1 HDIG domain-containing protein [bacterium]MDW8087467.1 HDIG domain-containing protein [Candidatus Calescibacterium sp.]